MNSSLFAVGILQYSKTKNTAIRKSFFVQIKTHNAKSKISGLNSGKYKYELIV
jgi:hypothetical protein